MEEEERRSKDRRERAESEPTHSEQTAMQASDQNRPTSNVQRPTYVTALGYSQYNINSYQSQQEISQQHNIQQLH